VYKEMQDITNHWSVRNTFQWMKLCNALVVIWSERGDIQILICFDLSVILCGCSKVKDQKRKELKNTFYG
jgi:hypothetical protein